MYSSDNRKVLGFIQEGHVMSVKVACERIMCCCYFHAYSRNGVLVSDISSFRSGQGKDEYNLDSLGLVYGLQWKVMNVLS